MQSAYAQLDNRADKVLILFDSDAMTLWKQSFATGFQDYVNNTQTELPGLMVGFEFLGVNPLPSGALPPVLLDMLAYKQEVDPAIVVVSTLSPNADSLYSFGPTLYADIPKVYALSNASPEFEVTDLSSDIHFLYGTDESNIENTLALIPDLLPQRKQLFIIGGNGELDLTNLEGAKKALATFNDEFEVNYLTGLTIPELLNTVRTMSLNGVVFFLTYQEDRLGQPLNQVDVISQAASVSTAPIFSLFSSMFVDGVLGGNYTNPDAAGKLAAQLALATHASTAKSRDWVIPLEYRFDQAQLRRWNVSEASLPAGSIIVNQIPTLLDLYLAETLIALSAFVLLLGSLAYSRYRQQREFRQRTLFESVINSIPDAVLLSEADDHIFASNDSATKLFGLQRDQLARMSTDDLITVESIERSGSKTDTAEISNDEPNIITFSRADGTTFPGEFIGSDIISSSGSKLGNFSLIRDISKRLSHEEELHQAQKMEALGQLVGGISHDFNNLLGVISGYSELLLLGNTQDNGKEEANQILKAITHGKALVQQVMSFSRNKQNKQDIINLNKLVCDTIELVRVSIPNNIRLTVDIAPDLPPIQGADIQIQQVILNLATNARQAVEAEGGKIKISLRHQGFNDEVSLSHSLLPPGEYCVLQVSDNGSGMTKEVTTKIFEPFFTTKQKGKGTGMGMAIVYRILQEHSAYFDLQSAPDSGTTIKIFFEAQLDAIDKGRLKANEVVSSGNGENILLVDDELELLAATEKLLLSLDYAVDAYSNPIQALQNFKLDPDKYDIIVSDEVMPNMRGLKLIKEIRKTRPEFPAIICTGYSDALDNSDDPDTEQLTIVRKPFNIAEISRSIVLVLNRRKHL